VLACVYFLSVKITPLLGIINSSSVSFQLVDGVFPSDELSVTITVVNIHYKYAL